MQPFVNDLRGGELRNVTIVNVNLNKHQADLETFRDVLFEKSGGFFCGGYIILSAFGEGVVF